MTTLSKKVGRVIDFEGSFRTGIQQASIIDFKNFQVINTKEYIGSDGRFSDWLLENTHHCQIDYWVAHNVPVEKNMVNKHTPYRNNLNRNESTTNWGPWLDTLKVYKSLYPSINNYALNNLRKNFIDAYKIEVLANKYCKRTQKKIHHSMFDSIITFLLLERLQNKINLSLFLV